ncbi:MAG: polysaccharide biosynthesis/export family protein [Chlamydiia bacterium]|nr:polysaccharide biosynthesis/export family protein [Chlamydiia bacterium]
MLSTIVRLCLSLLAMTMLSSCTQMCCGYDMYGPDEFVIDSYRIREGKFAILEFAGQEYGELPEDALEEYQDSLYEDDLLNIAVYHPTRKDLVAAIQCVNATIGFRIENGAVNIPDIARIEVAGLTLDEARDKIQDAFRKEIADIEVFISYRDRLSRRVDFTGGSGVPYLPVDGKMRLFEALSKARISPAANFFMSYVLRNEQVLPVDMHRLMVKGDMSQNIVLHGGDKIYIATPNESKIFVLGEVIMPRMIPIPSGSMPLCEALVTVGGVPFTGDRHNIQVIRGSLAQPKIYVLSWEHVVHLPNDSMLLMPGDTVYISEKPITQWNRFISQLLPSFNSLSVGKSAYTSLGLGL